MSAFVQDPRRAPRVPVRLRVDIGYGSAGWRGATDDLGPGGCLLAAGRALALRTPLSLVLHDREAAERLHVDGVVSWSRGVACGVAFGGGPQAQEARAWFERLLLGRPSLLATLAHARARIALDTRLSLGSPVAGPWPPRGDEARVLAHAREGVSVGLLALHARLPPDRFARALFALLERGVLVAPAAEGAAAGELDALVAALLRGTAGETSAAAPGALQQAEGRIQRAALHFRRIAEDIALGTRER